ncbi:uncharacterized protein LOC143344777 isoform X3 [Colletes latitarsis]|uniref:uncharacterized protein LOC143344777 isoform X3 n=1 Tax=Colletes latitarsis TaxID=2605962 RepID=UPI004037380F
MLQEEDKAPYESVLDLKGDDYQKLSVIHNLPSLLATDTQSCMSRVVPKMQQSLPTASTEFHLAASSTFKTILEQKLVSHNVFSQTFLQSILNSLDSRDPDLTGCDRVTAGRSHKIADTIKTTIVPLVKKLCENAMKSDDNVICIIAQEFGKLVLGLEKCLLPTEKAWFLKYFQQLAQMGIVSMKKESKPHLLFMTSNPAEDEKYMECRRCCAFNLPAMFLFVSNSSDDTDALLLTFNALVNDHYYMVRRTVASGIHEVAKILGPKSGRIKLDLIKLLKDDSKEVLQGLVPHIGLLLDCLAESQTIGVDRMDSTLMEIGRALIICEVEISSTRNWRLAVLMHSQLEIIVKYFPSDFIYSNFVPMVFFRILHARPIPVRLAAGTLYLFLLRYNMKPTQRVELRSRLYTELANSPDCYVRMMFVRMMVEALEIFSSVYFKEHFFNVLLNMAEDPVANIRIKVVSLLPQLKSLLWIPTDKKLLTALETTIGHLMNSEKDRDVIAVLATVVRKLNEMKLKYDGQTPASKHTKQDIEDTRKLEEEKRLSGLTPGKSSSGGTAMKKGAWRRTPDNPGKTIPPTSSKEGTGSPRHSSEGTRGRIQLTHPWERLGHTNSNASTTHANFESGPCHDFLMQKMQQNRSKLASLPLIVWPDSCECNYEEENNVHSCPPSDYATSVFLAFMRENRRKSQQNSLLTRDYAREFSTNIASKDTATARTFSSAPNLAMLRALTKAAHYNSCWPCSSMPEIPVMLSDDEFLVDAGIRIPAQFSSQSMSKIPHLQDSVFAKRRGSFNFDRSRSVGMNFDKGKPKRNSSVEYEDCMKRRTNGADQSNNGRTSMDCEDDLRLVKESQQLGKKDTVYIGPMMRSRFGFGVNQERSIEEKIKRNSLILDKDKPKILQSKCALDRTKRHSASFDKGKPKRNSSIEYEDDMKRRTNGINQPKDLRTSIDYEDGLRLGKDDQQLDTKDSSMYLGSLVRSRFGFVNQERSMDEKIKRNSLVLDKDKPKLVHTKCTLDRTKRHSANFSLKQTDSKDIKPNLKCHSLEVVDYVPSERLGRALRRYSTLDVNHNQGLSKIPLRSFVPRSRTAPATRASSPVHIDKLCRMPFWES